MEFREVIVADIEADGLRDTVSKIHCLGAAWRDEKSRWALRTTTNYEDIKRMFTNPDNVIAGHNFATYDSPVIEQILKCKVEATILDTLAIAYALFPGRTKYGLAEFGEDYGIPKPKVEDWKNQSIDVYLNRVSEDCKINTKLWLEIEKKLTALYGNDKKRAMAFCKYMTFKADCLREQEGHPLKINVTKAEKTLRWMERLKEEKIQELIPAMPKAVASVKTKPAKMTKKDGSISVAGQNWLDLLKEKGLPENYDGEVEIYKTPNPGSSPQIKDWLFSLGWKPKLFNKGKNGDVPQIRKDGELCKSVLKLADKEPAIHALDGITVLTHRIGVIKSFLKHLSFNDTVTARATGYANTYRLKHSAPLVNLPGVISKGPEKDGIRDGKWIRGLIEAEEGHILCGSDMSSLEDRMKQHYIYQFDPDYVHEMMTPDFDPHLSLSLSAGALTQEQVDAHKRGEEDHSAIRHIYKTCNYAAAYGIGAKSLAKAIKKSVPEAQEVLDAYRKKNWAVDRVVDSLKVKQLNGESWMKNPVNGFYYNLRSEKDKFSLLCQGGGTFIFDTWLHFIRSKGLVIRYQAHDECLIQIKDTEEDKKNTAKILDWAIGQVNKTLKLNREMACGTQFASDYSGVH